MTQARDLADGKFDTDTLVVDAANDRVGMGTTSPYGVSNFMNLTLKGKNASSGGLIRSETSDASITSRIYTDTNGLTLECDTDDNVLFRTNGSERGRFLSGGGLTFNGDTAAANALDDYEEGTWTPSPNFGGNSAGMTFAVGPTGYYTKVGRMVFVWFGFRFSNKGTSVGTFKITGLPYTIADTSGYTHPTNIAGGVPSANSSMFMALGSGSEIIYRRLDTTADDAADELDFNNSSGWFHSLIYHTS